METRESSPALDRLGLVAAWQLLAGGGLLHSVGWTSGEPAVISPYATVGPRKSLKSLLVEGEVSEDPSELFAWSQHAS